MRGIDAHLTFAVDNDPPKGFSNTDANRDQVKDEIVIRELLQNALDSGAGSRRVRFVLKRLPVAEIFGINEYRDAFEFACDYLRDSEPPTGLQMIRRVQKALKRKTLECLFCCDDGAGIGETELRSLYGSGRSTKRTAGRGSVGHGHLTAFVPSDLRYVLYGGRRAEPDGSLRETFGGHAIVATHIVSNAQSRIQRSADGFIRQERPDGQDALFDHERGGTSIPSAIAAQMYPDSSGSAVMIVAYKPVQAAADPNRLILAAAARHFLVAILDGALRVAFTDAAGTERSLTSQSLPLHVEIITPDGRRRSLRRTLRTLQDPGSRISGEQVEEALGPGARVWIRPRLEADETTSHRVSVFRDGMWIQDNTTNYLQPRHFTGTEPFDAVVDLDSGARGGMGKLVRDAEGASHLQITPSELDNPTALVERFQYLRELLKEHARQDSSSETYAPPQLRLTGSSISTSAIPKRRPKRPDSDPDHADEIEQEKTQGGDPTNTPSSPAPDPQHDPAETADRTKTDQAVKAGNSTGVSTSCRPDPRDPCLFHIAWSAAGRGFAAGAADLSLALPSGTDQTSRHRLPPEYLTIVSVRQDHELLNVPPTGRKQVRISNPDRTGTATVRVAPAVADAVGADRGLVKAVLFHRSRASHTKDRT